MAFTVASRYVGYPNSSASFVTARTNFSPSPLPLQVSRTAKVSRTGTRQVVRTCPMRFYPRATHSFNPNRKGLQNLRNALTYVGDLSHVLVVVLNLRLSPFDNHFSGYGWRQLSDSIQPRVNPPRQHDPP
ncbi:uncharacterized protein PgNI_09042 [Pyricularia grisea]|uniref:Uncharacterized protein n=1 Tax=Pyricularia grisea TaxID=148305 RepID=A0A6P8AVY4_PYRGI|nr:uncharacterized protein PgNI_09042 [Pyricularia grisea]TLD06391.1 hypothetical protein PgNI_09042 [Pyricularia grisea]